MAVIIDGTANTITAAATSATAATALSTASGSAPSYSARAWVNFNGTGTVAIRSSGNVSSITDRGTGQYTLNFTTAMPDANYSVSGSGVIASAAVVWLSAFNSGSQSTVSAPTTTSFQFATMFTVTNGAVTDPEYFTLSVFR